MLITNAKQTKHEWQLQKIRCGVIVVVGYVLSAAIMAVGTRSFNGNILCLVKFKKVGHTRGPCVDRGREYQQRDQRVHPAKPLDSKRSSCLLAGVVPRLRAHSRRSIPRPHESLAFRSEWPNLPKCTLSLILAIRLPALATFSNTPRFFGRTSNNIHVSISIKFFISFLKKALNCTSWTNDVLVMHRQTSCFILCLIKHHILLWERYLIYSK